MDDLRPAGAREPHIPAVSPAIQIAAALMLSDKGHQALSTSGMGREIFTAFDASASVRNLAKVPTV